MLNRQDSENRVGRRRFLGSAAIAGGAYVLANKAAGQDNVEEINVALIGAGSQGQLLLSTCVKIPGIRFRAICDIWEEYNLKRASRILSQFNQEHNTYTDYRAMLESEKGIDAVIIATPDFCHADQTVACLDAGANVYCESMMSNTIDGAREMIAAARRTGKLLQIGYQRRSNPQYRYSYDHVIHETQLLGKITALNGQWNRPVQPSRGWPKRSPVPDEVLTANGYTSMAQFRNWRWYKALGGGPLASLGSHQIDVFNWYMDTPPKAVMASGGTDYYDKATHEWHDTLMAILEFETPKRTVRAFYQTVNTNSNFGYYEDFMGDQGTLYVSEASGRVKVYREPAARDWDKWVRLGILAAPAPKEKTEETEAVLDIQETVMPPTYDLPVTLSQPAHQPHLENFFNAVRGDSSLNCPAEVAYVATACTLKIAEAAEKAQRITLDPKEFEV